MKPYQLSAEAADDLVNAYDYIGEHSEDAAERWRENLIRSFGHLAAWPNTGHIREDLGPDWCASGL